MAAEGTHTSEGGLFKMNRGGRGKNLYAGCVTLANTADYLDTGMDKIDAAVITELGAIAETDAYSITSVSGGIITFTAVGDTTPTLYVMAVGTVL